MVWYSSRSINSDDEETDKLLELPVSDRPKSTYVHYSNDDVCYCKW